MIPPIWMETQGDHRVNIIKLQVMFKWSLEWDYRGQISLPHLDGGKLKNSSSCTVPCFNLPDGPQHLTSAEGLEDG